MTSAMTPASCLGTTTSRRALSLPCVSTSLGSPGGTGYMHMSLCIRIHGQHTAHTTARTRPRPGPRGGGLHAWLCPPRPRGNHACRSHVTGTAPGPPRGLGLSSDTLLHLQGVPAQPEDGTRVTDAGRKRRATGGREQTRHTELWALKQTERLGAAKTVSRQSSANPRTYCSTTASGCRKGLKTSVRG